MFLFPMQSKKNGFLMTQQAYVSFTDHGIKTLHLIVELNEKIL